MGLARNQPSLPGTNLVCLCVCGRQLRPCPHLDSDVLSDCLSIQHLQGSASSEHLYNGKDGRSPGLGQDLFTGEFPPPIALARPPPKALGNVTPPISLDVLSVDFHIV